MIQQRQVGAFRPELQRQGPLQGSPITQQQKSAMSQAASLGADKFAAAALKGTPFAFLSPLAGSLFNDGGAVAGGLPPEAQNQIKQLLQALASGQVSPEQAVEMLVQAGIPQGQAMQMVQQAVGALQQQQTAQPAPQEAQQVQPGVSPAAGGSHPLTPASAAAQEGPLGLNRGGRTPSLAEQINWGGKYDKKKRDGKTPERSWYDPRGWVGKNRGGMVGHRNNNGEWVSGPSAQAGNTWSPDTFVNGKIASVHYPTPVSARNAPVGPLTGMYAMGGTVNQSSPGYYTRNNGGRVPLSSTQPQGPMHLNDGGMASEAPVKMVKKKVTRNGDVEEVEVQYDTTVPPISNAARMALG